MKIQANTQRAQALPKVLNRVLPKDRFQPTGPTDDLDLIRPLYSFVGGPTRDQGSPGRLESLPGWDLQRVAGLPRLEPVPARHHSIAALLASSLVGVAGMVFTGVSAAQAIVDPPPSFTQMRAAAELANPTSVVDKPVIAKKPSDLGALNVLMHGMKIPDSQWTIKAEYRKGPKLTFRTTF
jgi:hypothetical protein